MSINGQTEQGTVIGDIIARHRAKEAPAAEATVLDRVLRDLRAANLAIEMMERATCVRKHIMGIMGCHGVTHEHDERQGANHRFWFNVEPFRFAYEAYPYHNSLYATSTATAAVRIHSHQLHIDLRTSLLTPSSVMILDSLQRYATIEGYWANADVMPQTVFEAIYLAEQPEALRQAPRKALDKPRQG